MVIGGINIGDFWAEVPNGLVLIHRTITKHPKIPPPTQLDRQQRTWRAQMAVIRPNGHKTDHSRVSVVNGSYFTSGVKEKVEILILPLPLPPRPILGA